MHIVDSLNTGEKMMKKMIVAVALVFGLSTAYAATSDEWGIEEWANYCSEAWELESYTQEELDDYNANMMWCCDGEFKAVNGDQYHY